MKIISVRRQRRSDPEQDVSFIYCGRSIGEFSSPLGNPYRIGIDGS